MNHRYYSVNVSNANIKADDLSLSQNFIPEKELKEIYAAQYNDLFPKIISKTKIDFISLLKSQVSLHLKIINKASQNSLNIKFIEYFSKKFFNDKSKISKGLEEINKNINLQKNYLKLVNCYIHCHKCTKILHECKNNLIIHKGFIYCLFCNKVYNENQIKLFCDECKTCYYSKLRYILNKKYENFFHVCFKNYHCDLNENEKIKCLECGHDLYYNIEYDQKNTKKNGIFEIFCLKCKLLYDLNEVFFECKICKKKFKSKAEIHNEFSKLKTNFLLIMHTLRKKKLACPELKKYRKCNCDLTKYDKYLHENDKGVLYLGKNLKNEYVIICGNCYTIFNYNEFIWNCPVCNINFKSKKNCISKQKSQIQKNLTMIKSPSNIYIHRKKILENVSPTQADIKGAGNIIKNLFHESDEKINFRNSNKKNHITKIIMLTNNKVEKNIRNEKNLNLSEQKVNLFKKIKNISLKSESNYYTVDENKKEKIDIRKPNLKSLIKNKNYTNTSKNTINSGILNNINLSNNKSESNTNKCNDSTNITEKNNNNNVNNNDNVCKCQKCLIEEENNSINNINKKLIYNDTSKNEKNKSRNIENIKLNKIKTKEIKISKTLLDKDNENSINYLLENKNKNNNNNDICKSTKKPYTKITKFEIIKKDKKNIENILLDSVDAINNKSNIDNNNSNQIKNIKSMRNIKSNITNNMSSSKIRIKNIKNYNIIKTNNNNNQQNKLKENKSTRNINKINNNIKKDKSKIVLKRQISRYPTQFKIQNKKINNLKNNSNSNNNIKNTNLIFKKIKEYYEEGIEEETKNNQIKILKLNKNISKPNKYKTDFKSENYSILKLIGKGTYAKTYLVEDPKTKERYALKKITINDKIELKENKEEYNLILNLTKKYPELKMVNIFGIEIKNLDKYNQVMYILMEAAKYDWEKEILSHMDLNTYYNESDLINILRNLVSTLSTLQKLGISHRDVKPQNILCFENGDYKISDFGEAKNFNKKKLEENTMEQTLRGTELYMSPILFQALRKRTYQSVNYNSFKSDVFSLGMCLFLASSLSYEGLYEVREILKYKDKTRLVVNRYLSLKYSQKYINILISMLQINENDRPDFIELEKIVNNYSKA